MHYQRASDSSALTLGAGIHSSISRAWSGRAHRLAGAIAGWIGAVWIRLPAGRPRLLRVLAYHDIRDPKGFERQLEHLVSNYHPVGGEDVLAALEGSPLPHRAVWVTFDDGDPTLIDIGIDILGRHGVSATMFVCPGVVNTDEPYWWQIIDAAAEMSLEHRGTPITAETRGRLKTIPDPERRRITSEIRMLVENHLDTGFTRRQMRSTDIQRWLAAGHTVGNHTWDHPLLDTCDPVEQGKQIRDAHEWLQEMLANKPIMFAYPNGNWAAPSEGVLRELGYRLAVLFDHRLSPLEHRFRLSRLRTNADADLDRFKAIVSGLHPSIHQALGRP